MQSVLVFRKMRRNPVDNNAYSLFVATVDKSIKSCGVPYLEVGAYIPVT